MTLDDQGKLAIAELVYWAPGIVLATIVTFKHGFGRHAGFLFIILLGLARIIGASCTIAEEQKSQPDVGLLTAAGITNSIGLSFLIQAILGLISRVLDGTPEITHLPPRALKLLHLMLLVGIILGIVGGVDLSNGGNDVETGLKLLKASIILFTVSFILVGVCLALATINLRKIPSGEKRLVFASLASYPFIFVRVIYGLLNVFDQGSIFNYFNANIWARAFMAIAEEFIVATIVIVTGLITEKVGREKNRGQIDPEAPELANYARQNQPSNFQQEYGSTQGR